MENQEKIEKLYILRDLIIKKTYKLENIGIEGRKELKQRVIEKTKINQEEYLLEENLLEYLKSINRSSDFLENLPLVLKKSFEIYCGADYEDINNDFLRKNEGLIRETGETFLHFIDYTTFKEVEFYKEGIVDALDTIINQTKLEKGTILYRGCGIRQFNSLKINSSEELLLHIGNSFVEHGYTSTSFSFDGRFVNERPIIMVINVPPGLYVANFTFSSLSHGEGEILIEREVEYTITDVEIVDEKVIVYTNVKRKNLNKGVDDINKIKITENEKNLLPLKYEEEYYLDSFDSEIEDINSSRYTR